MKAESPKPSSGFMVPFKRGQSLVKASQAQGRPQRLAISVISLLPCDWEWNEGERKGKGRSQEKREKECRGGRIGKRAELALFVGLNMADLSTVGTFALRAHLFDTRCSARRWRSRVLGPTVAVDDAFLLLAGEATFLVALQASQLFLKPATSSVLENACFTCVILPLLVAFVCFVVTCGYKIKYPVCVSWSFA